MNVDLKQVEESAKELYIRALKILPPDIKSGIAALAQRETAATHITMNPVTVNMQCHSARRARATFTPSGVEYGF